MDFGLDLLAHFLVGGDAKPGQTYQLEVTRDESDAYERLDLPEMPLADSLVVISCRQAQFESVTQ